ncbi:type II toxin-antitoxin system VapB family antitoxin [Bartonella sp. DGB2]|uniref:type II toxin-antitoxin system VapB family antitoxin n=1 Tax=Bartonella sp. DGB2 TaxID=3388426 RepID=UPI00398FB773
MIRYSKVFMSNRSQNVRIPAEVRFPTHIQEVIVRQRGFERIIAPANKVWDSFFLNNASISDDFMDKREPSIICERESLDD